MNVIFIVDAPMSYMSKYYTYILFPPPDVTH